MLGVGGEARGGGRGTTAWWRGHEVIDVEQSKCYFGVDGDGGSGPARV